MQKDSFYQNTRSSLGLIMDLGRFDSFDEFESCYPEQFLNDDTQIGDYLRELLYKYDKKASAVSEEAGLATAYVGNIINLKRNNPSRDALISICLAIGTTFEEVQYLLKYAGQAPLYVRRKRDVVIWFGFMKGHNIDMVNADLIDRGMKPLIKE